MADPLKFAQGGLLLPLVSTPDNKTISPLASANLLKVEATINLETKRPRIVISFDVPNAEIHSGPFDKSDEKFLKEWGERKWSFWVLENTSQIPGVSGMAMNLEQPDESNSLNISCSFQLKGFGKINSQSGW